MALEPAITDIEQLKDRPAVAALLALECRRCYGAKLDRNELTIWVDRSRPAPCVPGLKQRSASCSTTSLADLTCVDWYPREPRFEVVYHLFSIPKKVSAPEGEASGADANIESLTPSGRARTSSSARSSTCSAFASMAIPTCRAS